MNVITDVGRSFLKLIMQAFHQKEQQSPQNI